jgi:hypothetical protein
MQFLSLSHVAGNEQQQVLQFVVLWFCLYLDGSVYGDQSPLVLFPFLPVFEEEGCVVVPMCSGGFPGLGHVLELALGIGVVVVLFGVPGFQKFYFAFALGDGILFELSNIFDE